MAGIWLINETLTGGERTNGRPTPPRQRWPTLALRNARQGPHTRPRPRTGARTRGQLLTFAALSLSLARLLEASAPTGGVRLLAKMEWNGFMSRRESRASQRESKGSRPSGRLCCGGGGDDDGHCWPRARANEQPERALRNQYALDWAAALLAPLEASSVSTVVYSSQSPAKQTPLCFIHHWARARARSNELRELLVSMFCCRRRRRRASLSSRQLCCLTGGQLINLCRYLDAQ